MEIVLTSQTNFPFETTLSAPTNVFKIRLNKINFLEKEILILWSRKSTKKKLFIFQNVGFYFCRKIFYVCLVSFLLRLSQTKIMENKY